MNLYQFANVMFGCCSYNDKVIVVSDITKKVLYNGLMENLPHDISSSDYKIKNLTMLNTDGDKCEEYSTVIVVTNEAQAK